MRSTTIVHVSGHIQISWYEPCLGYRDGLLPDAAGIVGGWRVLVFDVVRHLGAGPVAQWESVRFTRGRSLVRSQPGPQLLLQFTASFSPGLGGRARYVPDGYSKWPGTWGVAFGDVGLKLQTGSRCSKHSY